MDVARIEDASRLTTERAPFAIARGRALISASLPMLAGHLDSAGPRGVVPTLLPIEATYERRCSSSAPPAVAELSLRFGRFTWTEPFSFEWVFDVLAVSVERTSI